MEDSEIRPDAATTAATVTLKMDSMAEASADAILVEDSIVDSAVSIERMVLTQELRLM